MATADKPLPLAQQTAPERIYLDIGEEAAMHETFSDREVTWSADNATGFGVQYVRADLARAVHTASEAWLFEHEDGRYAVWPGPGSPPWAIGEPRWHRCGPVDVSGLSAAPQAPSGGEG